MYISHIQTVSSEIFQITLWLLSNELKELNQTRQKQLTKLTERYNNTKQVFMATVADAVSYELLHWVATNRIQQMLLSS